MNLKKIWDKITRKKSHSGILIKNNRIQIIKIIQKNNIFYPYYWNEIDFNISQDSTENIRFFKKIKNKLNDDCVNINGEITEIDKLISYIKIAGFKKVIKNDYTKNLDLLFTSKHNTEKTAFVFISDQNIKINFADIGGIYKQENFNISDFTEKIKDISKEVENRQVFLSGEYPHLVEKYNNIFHDANLEIEIFNPWINILNLEETIPDMLKGESHKYLKLISLTLPKLQGPIWNDKINNPVQNHNTTEQNLNFITNKINEGNEIIFEKELFWKNIWNSFKKKWDKSIFTIFWKFKKEEKKKKEKIFLLKPKLKLFLPRPSKMNKAVKKKTKKEKTSKTKKHKDKSKKIKRKTTFKKKE